MLLQYFLSSDARMSVFVFVIVGHPEEKKMNSIRTPLL